MNLTEIETRSDCEIVYLHGAVVSDLAKFLAPSVPWVWILGHRPNRYMQWWDATEFDEHGLVLIQSNQQMPDTLWLNRIPESKQKSVLMQNGATLRICLPHAGETAQVPSFTKGHLATIVGT